MHKIPSIFCHHTLHTLLDSSDILAIALEIKRLCSNTPVILNEYQKEIERLKIFSEHYIHYSQLNNEVLATPLAQLYKKLSRKSLITELFICAFLCADCSYTQDNTLFIGKNIPLGRKEVSAKKNFDYLTHIKRLLLFSTYRLLYSDTSNSKAMIMTNEFRQFTLGKRFLDKETTFLLPIVVEFDDALMLSHFFYNKSKDYLEKMGSGIHWALKETPNYPQTEVYVLNTKKPYAHNQVNSLATVKQSIQTSEKATINFWENTGNNDKDITTKESKKQVWISRYLKTDNIPRDQQVLASQETHRAISSRKRRLPCDASNLLTDNIITFLVYSNNHRGNKRTAIELLLWSLYLGKSLPHLAKAINENDQFICYNQEQEHYEIRYHLELPQRVFETSKGEIHRNEYRIQLPKSFNSVFHTFADIDKYLPLAKKHLRQFNKEHRTYLTLGNIGNYLENYLLNKGANKHLIQLLTEPMLNHQTPLYYTCIDSKQIFQLHQKYVNHLNAYVNYFIEEQKPHESFLVASKIIILKKDVREIFAILTKIIKNNIDKLHRNDEVLHNTFTVYLYLLLTYCNGYRPVQQSLGYAVDYDLSSGLCFISDKERGTKVEGRINYLGKTACQQLDFYLQYCRFQYFYYQQKNRLLANQYKKVLRGEDGLLFFLKNNNILPCTPKIIKAQFKEYSIGLPLNWARHYVLTLLLQLEVSDQSINAWSGHDDDGQIPFARFSNITTEDLRVIAQQLDTHLTQCLNVFPIKVYDE